MPVLSVGNEHADALAKKSATDYSDIADTSIRIAGPEGQVGGSIASDAEKLAKPFAL